MKVVDASAIIESLSRTPKAGLLTPLLDDDLFAPDLLVAEVVHYWRAAIRRGLTDDTGATAALDVFAAAPIDYLPIWPMTQRIWELRDNVTGYDACYIALAEELRCPLLTTDARLSRTPRLRVRIITI